MHLHLSSRLHYGIYSMSVTLSHHFNGEALVQHLHMHLQVHIYILILIFIFIYMYIRRTERWLRCLPSGDRAGKRGCWTHRGTNI